jgi:hypothetical protein
MEPARTQMQPARRIHYGRHALRSSVRVARLPGFRAGIDETVRGVPGFGTAAVAHALHELSRSEAGLNKESTVYSATAPHLTESPVFQPAPPSETTAVDIADYASPPALDSDTADSATTAHDPTLLIAALEEIEARRAAIEWLLEADLLCACSV